LKTGALYVDSSVINISEFSKFEDCSSDSGDGGVIYANQNNDNCKFSISDTTLDNCSSKDTTKVQMISLLISSYTSQIVIFERVSVVSDSLKTLIFIKVSNNYDNNITNLRKKFPDSCGWLNETNIIFNKESTNSSLKELICDDTIIYVSCGGRDSDGCGWDISPCLTISHMNDLKILYQLKIALLK
jgi:hypothetical protein